MVRTSFHKCTPFLNSEYNFQFYRRVIITCNNTACGGIREHNAVAFSSIKEFSVRGERVRPGSRCTSRQKLRTGTHTRGTTTVTTIIASEASFLVCSIARAVYIYLVCSIARAVYIYIYRQRGQLNRLGSSLRSQLFEALKLIRII